MSKTITIRGHVWDYHYGHPSPVNDADPLRFAMLASGPETASDIRAYVGPISVQYEVPNSYNPTQSALASLEREKAAVRAAYLQKVREIEERISKLQALTNEVQE